MVKESVVNSIKSYLETVREKGVPEAFGILFGSEANGNSHEWSDIDLLVVSPEFDGPPDRNNAFKLWRIAARTDPRIEPIPCGLKQWEEDDSSAIIEIARREGVVVRI